MVNFNRYLGCSMVIYSGIRIATGGPFIDMLVIAVIGYLLFTTAEEE